MTDAITHYVTDAPWYANPDPSNQWDKYVREWGVGDIDHTVAKYADRTKRHPVVFDIETTGRVPQEPILWTAYDSKTGHVDICYAKGAGSARMDPETMANEAGEAFREHGLYASPISIHGSVSPAMFENTVLRPAMGDHTRVLVGHNVFFDLNVAGRPNDGILSKSGVQDDWQAATEYGDHTLLSKRAGAYGYIYSLINHRTMDLEPTVKIADTRVGAKSMLIGGSLASACDEFDIDVDKSVDEHGVLSYEYLRYNVGDVASTHALYHELRRRLHMDFGANVAPEGVYSTASIFKDVLKRMDYDRVHYPKAALKIISPAYFGGRTEARLCGELIDDVTYTDILSEYPTVCSLSDVWRFMRAERVEIEQIDPERLPRPRGVDALADPSTWRQLADFYAVVSAEGAPLPVRTKLPTSDTTRVYNARVTHAEGVTTTHHFYDVLSSWLLSGEWPDIVAAFRVEPIGEQSLRDTNIGGRRIRAYDDILKRAIEERKVIEREYGKGPREKSLKITANSGYGVAAERLVAGDTAHLGAAKHDIAGSYYNPHVAATITAGGRLMLAYGERVANDHGGQVWYCDTDSLVIDDHVVAPVQAAFDPLNPYDGPAGDKDVLEVESENGTKLRGVSLFAVGEKKYAILRDGELIKFTEHGLGHYEQLRDPEVIARFWRTLLDLKGVDVRGELLSPDALTEPVIFQQPASTRGVRETIEAMLGEPIRYGDWIQQTVNGSPGSNVRYVGTNLDEQVIKIKDGEVTGVHAVDPGAVKNVRDVVDSWWQSSHLTESEPVVEIAGKRTVTKEAANVEMDIAAQLHAALSAVDLTLFGE